MTSTTNAPPDLAARYGNRHMRPWQRAGAVGLALAVLASVVYAGWRISEPKVVYNVLTFRIPSASLVDLTFEVQRSGESEVVCVLRAQDVQRHDVGYATVTIPPGADYVQPTYPLATRALATVVDVLGCAAGGPPEVPRADFPPGTVNPPQQSSVSGQ